MNLRNGLTSIEADRYRMVCNFTPNELSIFNLVIRDKSLVEIALETNLSIATVSRKLRNIKNKIART